LVVLLSTCQLPASSNHKQQQQQQQPTCPELAESLVGLVWLHRQRVAWRAALLQPMLHHHKPAAPQAHTISDTL
jgi:hypothetical protein